MATPGRILAVIVVLGLGGVVIFGRDKNQPQPASPASVASNEATLTPELSKALGSAIRLAGYNCPKAKLAYAEPDDPYGRPTEVMCGPENQDGVYRDFSFMVTVTPSGNITVHPK